MKKLLAFTLTVILTLSLLFLTACGGEAGQNGGPNGGQNGGLSRTAQSINRIDNRFAAHGDVSFAMAYMQNVLNLQAEDLDVLRYYCNAAHVHYNGPFGQGILVQYKEKNASSYGYLIAFLSENCDGNRDYRFDDGYLFVNVDSTMIEHESNPSGDRDIIGNSVFYLDEAGDVKAVVTPAYYTIYEKDSLGRISKSVCYYASISDPKTFDYQNQKTDEYGEYSYFYNEDGTLMKVKELYKEPPVNGYRSEKEYSIETTYNYNQSGLRISSSVIAVEYYEASMIEGDNHEKSSVENTYQYHYSYSDSLDGHHYPNGLLTQMKIDTYTTTFNYYSDRISAKIN